jgi:hypothetical protein
VSGLCLRPSTCRGPLWRAARSGPRHRRTPVAAAPQPPAARPARQAPGRHRRPRPAPPPHAAKPRPPEAPAPVTPAPHLPHHPQPCPKEPNARLIQPQKNRGGPGEIISPGFSSSRIFPFRTITHSRRLSAQGLFAARLKTSFWFASLSGGPCQA